MAYDASIIAKYNVANNRCHIISITADAAEAGIDTGLEVVQHYSYAPVSLTTGAIKIKKNTLSSGTAAIGYMGLSGVTSGDVFYLTAYGR